MGIATNESDGLEVRIHVKVLLISALLLFSGLMRIMLVE